MTFGEKLARERKELNYTQEQLAEILGVSRQSVSKWESDIAYPETEKLIKMGKLFSCSMDYLLDDSVTDKHNRPEASKESFAQKLKKHMHERKSEKMIFGMPIYHIGKNARGFFAVGFRARGVFSLGLISKGIFSAGLLSAGLLSLGVLSLGLLSVAVFSAGLVAVGSVALGILAAGAVSIGIISFGTLSVGCFSTGALAIGKYVAVGDHAYAMIALGESAAKGSIYTQIGNMTKEWTASAIIPMIDRYVPVWLSWAAEIFKLYLV